MSEISVLASANFLNQAALPLIRAAAIPRIQENPDSSSSIQDAVSISPEAKALHGYHN